MLDETARGAALDTQGRIQEAAVQLFASRGYRGATTLDVAKLAQVSEVTVFRYFPRKKDLYLAAVQSRLLRITIDAELREKLTSRADPGEVLPAILRLFVEIVANNPEVLTLFYLATPDDVAPSLTELYRKQLRSVLDEITSYLEWCRRKNTITDTDSYVTAFALFGTVLAHYRFVEPLTGKSNGFNSNDHASRAYAHLWLQLLRAGRSESTSAHTTAVLSI